MTLSNRLWRCSLVVSLCFIIGPVAAQEHPPMIKIGKVADVKDNAPDGTFFKIPELRAKDGKLEVTLNISEEVFVLGSDSVKMRTYTEHGKPNKVIGPWGPTLRIGRNDRLSVRIHNNLPDVGDLEYYGYTNDPMYIDSFDWYGTNFIEEGGEQYYRELSQLMKDSIMAITNDRIVESSLVGATIEVVEKGKEWILHAKVECKCPPGEEGTCAKIPTEYPMRWVWNMGSKEMAIRIYFQNEHAGEEHDHNVPHGFNTTNLHAHGFHVSPYQDDIFRTIDPGLFSYYTYDLKEHTPGTMWYHPHVHGSTALQVASGMSGAIIIEDDPETLKDFPNLAAASLSDHERIMLFNQINYDTQINESPDFNTMNAANAPQGTTINGVVKPVIKMKPGEVQRWRLIYSGYNSDVVLDFPEGVEVMQIAVDGIMFSSPKKVETVHLGPGNRADLLVRCMKADEYEVKSGSYLQKCEYFYDDPDCQRAKSGPRKDLETMLSIDCSGDAMKMSFPTSLPGPLGHTRILGTQVGDSINGDRHTQFDVLNQLPGDTTTGTYFAVDSAVFEHGEISHKLPLGAYESWVVSSGQSHPYHIHVNPFMVVKCGDTWLDEPQWRDVAMASPKLSPGDDGYDAKMGDILFYTHYSRYTGDFVIHCHILHHEDQGMMQRVRIVGKEEE